MVKRFKAKKKMTFKKTKHLFYAICILSAMAFTFQYLYHLKFATNNQEFIKYLLEDSNHFKEYNSGTKKIVYKVTRFLTGVNMNKPVSLLENNFHYKNSSPEALVYNEEKKETTEPQTPTATPTPTPTATPNQKSSTKEKPLLYIYTTHQTEDYASGNLNEFGITPDVMMAAYLLKDRIEKQGVSVMIEERSMGDYLKQNNLNYDKSYTASRYYAKDVIDKNPNIDFVIDLHRDALAKNLSTTTIGDKNYAKILFVLGGKAATYKNNLEHATTLNNKVKETYPTLTRGLLARDYSIYNQDLTNHSILVELGGNENTVDEVMNTVEAISPIIASYVGDLHGK
ncbi:MAG: stage II sporulation protein P [Bacilli bacterium]|nr:stage II sporulation protein P [Bacilli bacterium]